MKVKFSVHNAKQTILNLLLFLLNKLASTSKIEWVVTGYQKKSDGSFVKAHEVPATRMDLAEWLFIDSDFPVGIDKMKIESKVNN